MTTKKAPRDTTLEDVLAHVESYARAIDGVQESDEDTRITCVYSITEAMHAMVARVRAGEPV